MKLRNKKTGEIVDLSEGFIRDTYCGSMIQVKPVAISNKQGYLYESLAELNEEWEDYEESKEYWCITGRGNLHYLQDITDENDKDHREIGNYFETREEAEKVVKKLRAWQRLKDKGFRFDGYDVANRGGDNVICGQVYFKAGNYDREEIVADLDLLFGGGK